MTDHELKQTSRAEEIISRLTEDELKQAMEAFKVSSEEELKQHMEEFEQARLQLSKKPSVNMLVLRGVCRSPLGIIVIPIVLLIQFGQRLAIWIQRKRRT